MSEKLRSVTVRVPPAVLDRVEELAKADRRPVAQLVRNFIEDAVVRRADAGSAIHA